MTTNNRNEFTVRPWNELRFNPIYDDNDPLQQRPFLTSINMNKDQYYNDSNSDIQLVRSSQDVRIRHYKCNWSSTPAEALAAVNEVEGVVVQSTSYVVGDQ